MAIGKSFDGMPLIEYNICKGDRYMSDFLFSMPSVADGIAGVIDLFGAYPAYNESQTAKSADLRAYFADIAALKQDAQAAFQTVVSHAR